MSLLFCTFLFITGMNAQINTPQASPKGTVSQQIGLTDFSITYSRPSAKGRVVFGDVVPFGKTWRTGANQATLFTVSDDVTIEGQELKAGKYALYTVPEKNTIEWIFYKNTTSWGLPEQWNDADVAIKVKTAFNTTANKTETLTFNFDELRNNSAVLKLSWDNMESVCKIAVNTDNKVLKDIEKALAGPSANDYYAAGKYYYESDKDLNKSYEWIHKANEMSPKYFTLRQEALVLAKMKKYKEAVTVAQKSLELAKAAGSDEYVKMNTKDIADWSKMK